MQTALPSDACFDLPGTGALLRGWSIDRTSLLPLRPELSIRFRELRRVILACLGGLGPGKHSRRQRGLGSAWVQLRVCHGKGGTPAVAHQSRSANPGRSDERRSHPSTRRSQNRPKPTPERLRPPTHSSRVQRSARMGVPTLPSRPGNTTAFPAHRPLASLGRTVDKDVPTLGAQVSSRRSNLP